MGTRYREAPEVKQIADDLIFEHSLLGHLQSQSIRYRWREKAQEKNGKTVLGTAKLVGGSEAVEATGGADAEEWVDGKDREHFRIEIAFDAWQGLTKHQRQALVFHELLHCGADDKGKPMILPHDVEEFRAAVETFGLWKTDLEAFARSVAKADGQLPLRLDDDDRGSSLLRDTSITISTPSMPGHEVTLTGEQFERAVARM